MESVANATLHTMNCCTQRVLTLSMTLMPSAGSTYMAPNSTANSDEVRMMSRAMTAMRDGENFTPVALNRLNSPRRMPYNFWTHWARCRPRPATALMIVCLRPDTVTVDIDLLLNLSRSSSSARDFHQRVHFVWLAYEDKIAIHTNQMWDRLLCRNISLQMHQLI